MGTFGRKIRGRKMGTVMSAELVEIWKCARRRCHWAGLYEELRQVPDRSSVLVSTKGTCPDCGHDAFYVRKNQKRPGLSYEI